MIGNIWDTLIIMPMLNSLLWIYSILGNFAIAIILFTILVRLITHPLTVRQLKGTQAMQDMQKSKEWQDMQKKYKNDKQKLQQEQMRLYKEMGVNPLGSCLPTLIQFPIIIGLYQAVIRALAVVPLQMTGLFYYIYPFSNVSSALPIDSRFLWMDLSLPERLYIPGINLGFPILAILVLVTTYFQTRLITPPAQPGEQGAQMTQMMNLYMPLLMGYLAYTFAAGLALYFITSNVVTILQYALMGRANWSNMLPSFGRKQAD
jgi:YidC/Oxa1 family membrane protein insertase